MAIQLRYFNSVAKGECLDPPKALPVWSSSGNPRMKPSEGGNTGMMVSNLEIKKMPIFEFKGHIITVANAEEEKRAMQLLEGEKLLGFDSESRPSPVGGGSKNPTAVIQLSSGSVAVLWLVAKAGGLLPGLARLLTDASVHKVCHGASLEVVSLEREFGVSPRSLIDLYHQAIVHRCHPKSLQGVVALFLQKQLVKDLQLSDWESGELSPSQVRYAATDAFAARECLLEMRRAGLRRAGRTEDAQRALPPPLPSERLLDPQAARGGPQHPPTTQLAAPSGTRKSASAHLLGSQEDGEASSSQQQGSRKGERGGGRVSSGGPSEEGEEDQRRAAANRELFQRLLDTHGPSIQPFAPLLSREGVPLSGGSSGSAGGDPVRALSALCGHRGIGLDVGGLESTPEGFRSVLSISTRGAGRPLHLRFRSLHGYGSLREAQNDAALQALVVLLQTDRRASTTFQRAPSQECHGSPGGSESNSRIVTESPSLSQAGEGREQKRPNSSDRAATVAV
uniref:3'-5' exonuclease domain-containing protein n=1 Tax=Chromera velia CCMP2878 TaxID=1169474 RepID=A0A0G4GJB5_9ALVE|eukprot:Cvel_4799.t1-p1 / transcript=Cvel_4799.t1 / gene=Cvel_4799 / organism=Chromera_velia_CCMP2878 / gene_product=hypothetical protein / transcript_product=hypothetical protein / location=Cvel_scaffold214:100820-104132(+) / protein_length=507 / sequence_SO=supercontig / SO=protein_coding / is_pseudo=false